MQLILTTTTPFVRAQLILAEMEIDSAVERVEPAISRSYAEAVSVADESSTVDSVSEQIRSTVGSSVKDEDLRPRIGLSWWSWKEADAFVRLAGARTAPYRMMPGGKVTSRRYCCRTTARSGKQEQKHEAGSDGKQDGCDAEQAKEGCGCAGQVVIQQCTVKALINGTVRR